MNKYKIFKYISGLVSLISILFLISIVIFIVVESLPFLKSEGILELLRPGKWKPISSNPSFSVFNMAVASLYIFLISLVISVPISLGTSIYINLYIKDKTRKIVLKFISILAGVPSVVMGFIGLIVIVKLIENIFGIASGESILAGGVVVSLMTIPFILNTLSESIEILVHNYKLHSDSLGVSKEYFIRNIILKKIKRSISIGIVLAFSRVIGETMAIMMVIGNTPIFPKILGKGETIPGLIAIEMGMAEVGSIHYSALFSSGLILLVIISIINIIIQYFKNRGLIDES